ncbi:MAG: hypothetical protein AAF599_16840, partial [Bacteroidota bacterium]
VKIDGKVVIDEPGYAFTCDATHRNEISYMISNNFANSFAFFNHPSNQEAEISSSFRWLVTGEEKSSFFLPSGVIHYKADSIGYYNTRPVEDGSSRDTAIITKEEFFEFAITEKGANFIRGTFEGTLKKTSFKEEPILDEGRVVKISGEFDLPLYKNCEISVPIGLERQLNSILQLPYNVPQSIESKYIKCLIDGIQRNLISTVPADFVQFDEAPQSLLQNEHDYYVYWENASTDTPSEVLDFECKVNVDLPNFKGIAELSDYEDSQTSIDKKLEIRRSTEYIRTVGVLRNPENGKALGLSSMLVINSEIKQIDCQ